VKIPRARRNAGKYQLSAVQIQSSNGKKEKERNGCYSVLLSDYASLLVCIALCIDETISSNR